MNTKTKEFATKLRQQGDTYQQIADKTGYSVAWCKLNLKEVVKDTKNMDLMTKCISLAQRNEGITNEEIFSLVRSTYPELTEYEDLQPISRKIKARLRQTDGCIIRPAWMVPNAAQMSMTTVLQAINTVELRLQDEIQSVMHSLNLDMSARYSIEYSIISMLAGGKYLRHTNTETICKRLQESIDMLEDKQDQYNIMLLQGGGDIKIDFNPPF